MEGVGEREMSGVDGRVMAGVVGVDTTLMGGDGIRKRAGTDGTDTVRFAVGLVS
jgi:hypothetical protein